ncbi:RNA-guided endonuclease TnpB family protein [Fusobacterium polymorphum]
MKIDLLDIETQYVNNRNLNYAKKHYIELKYGIIRLEITYIDKIDSTFIEMESIIAGYENETSLTINNEGNYEYSSCTCGFHNSMEPCGHVWQLAKYKCKSNPVQSYTTNNQNTIYIKDRYIKLPKLKSLVKIKLHRKIKGIIKSVTISKNIINHYFVSILCEEKIEELAKTNKNIGIDLGIKEFATMSDCTKVENLKLSKEYEKKLKREQRKLSRRCKLAKDSDKKLSDSRNYQKQKKKVAKIHNKIRNKRKDFINKLSTKIINNHDIICIEDLNIKGMLKNHKLAKSISDVSWSEFVRQLEYKANWYGRKIVKVPTFYPSSKTCSSCGNIKETLKLSERIYHCECCGLEIDRDYNASINILRKGLEI